MELDDLSFQLILAEIEKTFTFYRDGLAAYGAYCSLRKVLSFTKCVCSISRQFWGAKYTLVKFRKFGKWAVVTGCTEGIGKAFAQELAHHGMNIVMLSKPMNGDLERVAEDIRQQFAVQVITHAVDFSKTNDVYNQIEKELQDKEIGVLVNNVGVMYSYPMPFLDVPEEKLWHLINVNIVAATMMTSIVLPHMVKRRTGAIINMSSITSSRPNPLMAVYSATKTYLDHFSRALHYEYQSKGIIIQSLAPFYVATRMTSFSRTLSSHSTLIPSASEYVRNAVTTLGVSSRSTGYWPHTLVGWFIDQLPECVWLWLSTRLNGALRRQAQQRARHRSDDQKKRHRSGSTYRSCSNTSQPDVTSRRASLADVDRITLRTNDVSPRGNALLSDVSRTSSPGRQLSSEDTAES